MESKKIGAYSDVVSNFAKKMTWWWLKLKLKIIIYKNQWVVTRIGSVFAEVRAERRHLYIFKYFKMDSNNLS